MTEPEYAEHTHQAPVAPARSLRQIVKRLLSVPPGKLGPNLLVQRNERDAVLLLDGEHLVVLLASDPHEDVASTLAERLDAALPPSGGRSGKPWTRTKCGWSSSTAAVGSRT